MSVTKTKANLSRRGFLKSTAILGGAAATVSMGQSIADTSPAQGSSREDEEQSGYHLTPHILEYYKKARF